MVIDDDENVGSGLNPNAHALFIAGTMNTASEQFAPFICKTQDYDWQEGWALAENGTSLIYHKDESNNASPDQVSSVTFNDGIPSIYSAFTDDSIDSLKINGPNGTVAANFDAYTTQPILGLIMNANNNGVRQHLDGNIGDLVMYDATLTVIQRRSTATYLRSNMASLWTIRPEVLMVIMKIQMVLQLGRIRLQHIPTMLLTSR